MTVTADLAEEVARFGADLPYTRPPFSSRRWGHPLHSLCSYQGKLKPALAYTLLEAIVPKDASVLDPLGGVGTIAFEAALGGRASFSNDLSPLAFLVARAKLDPPGLPEIDVALDRFAEQLSAVRLASADRRAAEFGLNARVVDYFHPETLDQVLSARRLLAAEPDPPPDRAFIWACLLHVLHGNRPYALSRVSHPITPFSPTGPFVKKDLVTSVRAKAHRALSEPLPDEFKPGTSIHGDFRTLPDRLPHAVDAIITSPPFLGMRFDRPNWLRLWFCGWTSKTFHDTLAAGFLERQQTASRECYRGFFEACAEVIEPDGLCVIHVGSGPRGDLSTDLRQQAAGLFKLEADITEDVAHLEQHGLPDKRLTREQHLLVFLRN